MIDAGAGQNIVFGDYGQILGVDTAQSSDRRSDGASSTTTTGAVLARHLDRLGSTARRNESATATTPSTGRGRT
jgi:hypothetical protein